MRQAESHGILIMVLWYDNDINERKEGIKMIKKIKNLFSNRKDERENNINDLFSEIDKTLSEIDKTLLENNQKMILSYYNNENRK